MSRLDLITDAVRPKLAGRALFQGPQGSGKTWTMLNVARLLAGPDNYVIGIDTEKESMLTYADVFRFKHLPWRPPYDPGELTVVLDQLATKSPRDLGRPLGPDDVVIIDSFSHFWMGTGGTLDIANGRVQGGWDKARPIQNALVDQILAMPCHVLLGARMKNTVLVSDGGKTIENVGLTITQDADLGYELNVVVQMDMQHNATVMKSRTPAVPVGRVYPGGYEKKLAEDYAEWLEGGVPPANREDVERIVETFAGITDVERRKALKEGFVEEFGMPHSLTADAVPAAYAWLEAQGAPVGIGPGAGIVPDEEVLDPPGTAAAHPLPDNPEFDVDGDGQGQTSPDPALAEPESAAEDPAAQGPPTGALSPQEAAERPWPTLDAVEVMTKPQAQRWLKAAGLDDSGLADEVRTRLYAFVTEWEASQAPAVDALVLSGDPEEQAAAAEQAALAAEADAQAAAEAEAYAAYQAEHHGDPF